jgi:dolichyl-phosphate beta-glucosyltransferase
MPRPIELSVIIPCYRRAELARESVDRLSENLPRITNSWEIIVVDDGGNDFRAEEWKGSATVRLIQLPRNQGKGAAVRAGLLQARGRARIFTDVDLPFGFAPFPGMIDLLLDRRFHLVIGDRNLPDSNYDVDVKTERKAASYVFTRFVGILVTGGFFDTQCGLKGIRGDVADALCPVLRVDRFAFDVELIYVALKHALDIKRIPVHLERNETSSVRLLRDSSRSIWDILSIKLHQLQGIYRVPALDQIVRDDIQALGRARAHNLADTRSGQEVPRHVGE